MGQVYDYTFSLQIKDKAVKEQIDEWLMQMIEQGLIAPVDREAQEWHSRKWTDSIGSWSVTCKESREDN